MHRLKIVRDGGAIDAIMLPAIPRRGDWIIYDADSRTSWLAKVTAVALWHPDPSNQWEAIVKVSGAKSFHGAHEAEAAWLGAIEGFKPSRREQIEFDLIDPDDIDEATIESMLQTKNLDEPGIDEDFPGLQVW